MRNPGFQVHIAHRAQIVLVGQYLYNICNNYYERAQFKYWRGHHTELLGRLGPAQTPYLSCAISNTFLLRGRIKRRALPYPKILPLA